MDINPIVDANSRVVIADIRDSAAMQTLCREQDVLVHLAYIRQDSLGKVPGEVSDIGASMNLFEAAREGGVKKDCIRQHESRLGLE